MTSRLGFKDDPSGVMFKSTLVWFLSHFIAGVWRLQFYLADLHLRFGKALVAATIGQLARSILVCGPFAMIIWTTMDGILLGNCMSPTRCNLPAVVNFAQAIWVPSAQVSAQRPTRHTGQLSILLVYQHCWQTKQWAAHEKQKNERKSPS